ncbi:MAG: hypothetical protein A3C03_01130 [Candidatus Colwellbacteria bacterium RIFCSPHIGHO2_02_FULL_45_17]|uniref:UDP-N-acetylmuramoyl-L-alanyl-D-glutamate--2, 6-diaminopimelate ligase n=2 Tax=Candidatus Colwelliibacteriota TaxID=1817904 RepID=A0A1G1ZEE4_9BACT|nr:MAG: hypothetical protein A3C03_01130 [Candidatus Colwellbacteria bacterium RIFCSPHIGHO2_02_FULL_45_17]OGY60777.1 MAG: hypothetical protein A3I33_02355 [Candidatus Colwellbacteria bacterium RIFCSPLOWO2_02_FULL_45_11]OGY62187.1 MAG: hypothetical protein A3G58_02195 [Candidatus Colwellbacteria bacterium RIFCSPLOWO2_12_FULL_46_17]
MKYAKRFLRSVIKLLGLLKIYHFALAWGASVFYGRPSRQMTVIGVTGTKGKTTVAELISAILNEAGEKTVLSSSHRFQVGDRSWTNKTGNTMPGRGLIQKLLRDGAKIGSKYGIVEVVSEGVVQYRHKFMDFDIAVFTGLHPEHIESHGGLEKYREAKLNFFRDVKKNSKKKDRKFVINKNNEHSKYFLEIAGSDTVLYEKYDGPIKIIGDFNRENAAAAATVAQLLGVSSDVIKNALAKFSGVPGRMEFVKQEPFKVVVDYAHTPGSLEAAYGALKNNGGGLICVFGSDGGGRDKWKRPELGKIAGRHCKEIILTSENPYEEDPQKIIKEIRAGTKGSNATVYEIPDRTAAIRKAINLAKPGDTIILTGKGSEPFMKMAKGKKIPWSDRDVAIKELGDKI